MGELRELIPKLVDGCSNDRINQSLGYETPADWYYTGINAPLLAA